MRVLIVDDEITARRALERILQKLSFVEVTSATSVAEATAVLDEGKTDVALIDLGLGPVGEERAGLSLVEYVRTRTTAVPIVVTGSRAISEVRTAMRLGAHDYILKDELSDELVLPLLRELDNKRELEQEVRRLRAKKEGPTTLGIVGTSAPIQRLLRDIERVAHSERPVLVLGPTGSGKEVVVRAIHALGRRADQPFLDLNCGALPAALIESQLFGHERGAFTGADRKHTGFFSSVGGGTLFLDEMAELPLELQAKLLRVLETSTFRPLGAIQPIRFEGRIVAATHANLEERVANGSFREDLYYRLNVLEVRVPSLEERRDDIPALVAHFASHQERPLTFTEEAIEALQNAAWPGNVRQLRNVIDRLAVFAPEGPITAETIRQVNVRPSEKKFASLGSEIAQAVLQMPCANKLAFMETALIDEAMRLADGNKAAAARLLGVHRKVVERRLEKENVTEALC